MNSPVISKEIEFVVKYLSSKKTLGPDDFTAEFYHIFKGEIIQIAHKFFQKREVRGTLSNSFYEISIILVTKLWLLFKRHH